MVGQTTGVSRGIPSTPQLLLCSSHPKTGSRVPSRSLIKLGEEEGQRKCSSGLLNIEGVPKEGNSKLANGIGKFRKVPWERLQINCGQIVKGLECQLRDSHSTLEEVRNPGRKMQSHGVGTWEGLAGNAESLSASSNLVWAA